MKRPLIVPYGGRSDSNALYQQPGFTTKSARNVRGRDCVTGRLRISSRAGMRKFCATPLGAGKVKALVSTAIDDRKVSYSFTAGQEDELWSTPTPSKSSCVAGVTDRQGNIYAIDGNAGVVKLNSAKKLLMKIALPVADANHVVRALFVDDADRIFAGVSEGGDVATAKVFCVLQRPQPGQVAADDPNQYFILWELTPGAYTEALIVYRGSQLYAAHNYPTENRARVVVYGSLGLVPEEVNRIESVPYPLNDMDVGEDGSVYCASPDNLGDARSGSSSGFESYRPGHPSARGFHPPIVAWTPKQLTDAAKRLWSEYDAADIDETDLDQTGKDTPSKDEGQELLRWRDTSGNGRHFYAGSIFDSAESGPLYAKTGPGGLPAVRFVNVGTTKQSMATLPNASVSKTQADQQRTAIPAHEGAMWALFILLRVTVDDVTGTDPRVVFYAENDATAGTPGPHGLWINRACGPVQPGTFSLGSISYFAKTDATDKGACAGFSQAAAGGYTNSNSRFTDCVLVTIVWDGGIDPADPTKTRCLVRLNGRPIDRFEGLAFKSLKANYLAYAPTVATAVANRLNGEICHIVAIGRRDRFDDSTEPKILTHDLIDFTADFPGGLAQTDHELARIESYMLHKRGLGHLLGGSPGAGLPGQLWPHFYGQNLNLTSVIGPHGPSSPPDYDGAGRSTALEEVLLRYACTTKHDNKGVLLWTCNEITHPDTGTNRGGIGYGVRARKVASDGLTHVWLAGPDSVQATPGDVALRKIIDKGASFSGLQADGAWRRKFTGNADIDYAHPRMASDKFGNLYFPGYNTGSGTIRPLHIFRKDPDGSGNAVQLTEFLLTAPANLAFAIALPPDALTPDYRTDLPSGPAEVVYLFVTAGDGSTDPADSIFKIQLVATNSQASGSPRTIVTLGVSGTDIKTIDESTVAIPSGGAGVIDSASQFVQAFQTDNEIVILDGLRYWVYSAIDGTVSALEATSAGEIPPRAKLGCVWRHRLILARFADKPGRYAASGVGDIRDWDFRREPRLSTMAFDASLTRAGEVEDVIVALEPYSDDLLFVFGESRILRLTGDPQAGGQIDKVSDDIGGVFGNSTCKDQSGRVFFFGNPPGLYLLTSDGIEPLTRYTIEETEFAAIDYSTHRIELAWDPIQKGVHIFRVPHGAGGTLVTHWFWEEKTHQLVQGGAIWTDSYAASGKQPTAATFLAGDSTRALLIGCEDGFVRIIDPAATDDDGSPIDSLVVMGPVNDTEEMLESGLVGTQITLARDQGGARLELFATEEAEDIGPVLEATDLQPGLNDVFRKRVRGNYIWVRLRNALAGRRWAMERGEVEILPIAVSRNHTS